MKTVYLKNYLMEVKRNYAEARKTYVEIAGELDAHNKRWQEEIQRGWCDFRQKQEAENDYYEKKTTLKKRIERLQNETQEQVNQVRTEVERLYTDYHRPKASQVDLQALELLRAGVLTDRELMLMVEDYSDNFAMLKILKTYVDKSADKSPQMASTRAHLTKATTASTTCTDAIDGITEWGKRQMQDDCALADRMATYFERETNKIIEALGSTVVCEVAEDAI